MPYKNIEDQYACNRRYYDRNKEELRRKRRERYRRLKRRDQERKTKTEE